MAPYLTTICPDGYIILVPRQIKSLSRFLATLANLCQQTEQSALDLGLGIVCGAG